MSDLLKHPGESSNDTLPPSAKAAAHSRRNFLFKLSLLLNAAVGTVLAVPLVGYLLGPTAKKDASAGGWVNLGKITVYPAGETRLAEFESPVARFDDGQTAKVACWVRCVSASEFQVFAVNCAHLGCPVRWFSESKLFLCPCHGGAYYQDGRRAAGPPERGLFEYRTKLEGGSLMIHAGEMPTPATQASCAGEQKPLIQIVTAETSARPIPWQT
jgi:menaquinol-cytochrome c reductase iron-sulfur subunit